LGIKLIYSDKLFWIHSVEFCKKKGKNGYYLVAINKHYKLVLLVGIYSYVSIIGHVSINVTSAVLTNVLMIKKMYPLGILGIFIRTSPISVSAHFMPLQMQMKRK
jgi:hypothetical protein